MIRMISTEMRIAFFQFFTTWWRRAALVVRMTGTEVNIFAL
jgi:hypothetical protein